LQSGLLGQPLLQLHAGIGGHVIVEYVGMLETELLFIMIGKDFAKIAKKPSFSA
jgi:hypothetical protein